MGIVIDTVEHALHIVISKGWKRRDEGAMVKDSSPPPGLVTHYGLKTVVEEGVSDDWGFLKKSAIPITEEFPEGFSYSLRGEFNYGRELEAIRRDANRVDIRIATMVGTYASESYAVARVHKPRRLVLSGIIPNSTVVIDDSRLEFSLQNESSACIESLACRILYISSISQSLIKCNHTAENYHGQGSRAIAPKLPDLQTCHGSSAHPSAMSTTTPLTTVLLCSEVSRWQKVL
ncbi:hypothetical protein B9Z19DRAFT_1168418 [Tuber borchii]|uniref:5'-3' exoribonuclease 1 D1 domain-containing protein n=1 Tax=Tuber borchii TaxID=42251 RepID=A0A2T7A055_TUBBO|nr:hypothetical protein B9Z19DRAFT_1168418 [Tuber borchii]